MDSRNQARAVNHIRWVILLVALATAAALVGSFVSRKPTGAVGETLPEITNVQGFNNQVSAAVGVAVDSDDNVFVQHDQQLSIIDFRNAVTKFSSSGAVLGQAFFGGFFDTDLTGHLAVHPVSGDIWYLSSNGQIRIVDHQTLNSILFLDIRTIPVSTVAAYDMGSGTVRDVSGQIFPAGFQTVYGDLALLSRGDTLDILVAGRSIAFPFITRIRLQNLGSEAGGFSLDAKVLVTSTVVPNSLSIAESTTDSPENGGLRPLQTPTPTPLPPPISAPPFTNSPRGVAVTPQGTGSPHFLPKTRTIS